MKLIVCLLPIVYSSNLTFPRLHDDPIPGRPGAKVFLKNRLLDNLNSFFGAQNTETLEILDSTPQHEELESNRLDSVTPTPPPPPTPFMVAPAAKPTDIPSMKFGGRFGRPKDAFVHRFPTLIPTEAPSTTPTIFTIPTTTKKRSEGKLLSEKSIDSIREWRKRLYKAFKWKKAKDLETDSESTEIKKEFSDSEVAKNRQIIESRKEPHQATSAINTEFKKKRLFGAETSGFKANKAADVPQVPRNPVPLTGFSSNFQGSRMAYRKPGREHVVYLPAPQAPTYLPPASQHIVTVTSPPYPSVPTLPPMITFQANSPMNLLQEFAPQYTTPPPTQQQFNSIVQQPQQFNSLSQTKDRFVEEIQTEDEMFGPPVSMNNDCADGMCQTAANGQIISEEKCNSNRLRTIIQNNIVANDAEASKRAVQMAAESETGAFFDAVCGTGFFSYIAHTDEFCLASSAGVNCYVFSPVCADSGGGTMFGMSRRSVRRTFVNKN